MLSWAEAKNVKWTILEDICHKRIFLGVLRGMNGADQVLYLYMFTCFSL
jgi:hypothetical protein